MSSSRTGGDFFAPLFPRLFKLYAQGEEEIPFTHIVILQKAPMGFRLTL